MSQQFLDGAQIRAFREQVRGKGMAQGVRVRVPARSQQAGVFLHDAVDRARAQPGPRVVQKQSLLGSALAAGGQQSSAPRFVVFQRLPRLGSVGHQTLLAALPAHAQHLLGAVHVLQVQPYQLAHAQAGAVEQLQDGPVAGQERRLGAISFVRGLLFLHLVAGAFGPRLKRNHAVQETVHFFRPWNFRQMPWHLRRWHQPPWVRFDLSLTHGVPEKRAQRG